MRFGARAGMRYHRGAMYKRKRPYPSENRKLTEKRCAACDRVLPIDHFEWGRANWLPKCKECSAEWRREYSRQFAKRNRRFVAKRKGEKGCLLCGEGEPCALLFHHRDPGTKLFNVSQACGHGIGAMKKEAAKCEVLCLNCHAKVHAGLLELPPPADAPPEEPKPKWRIRVIEQE